MKDHEFEEKVIPWLSGNTMHESFSWILLQEYFYLESRLQNYSYSNSDARLVESAKYQCLKDIMIRYYLSVHSQDNTDFVLVEIHNGILQDIVVNNSIGLQFIVIDEDDQATERYSLIEKFEPTIKGRRKILAEVGLVKYLISKQEN